MMHSVPPGPVAPAAYRSLPDLSRGRFVAEPPSASRTVYQRDRDRIIHAAAFRRLALKTQVFLPDEGDHYRTRLTHTIEVAQIARTLTRALGLDDDLTEALALAHDLGHAPFGHTGEEVLDEAVRDYGGFDHNIQTVRIVTFLERRYPAFPGLNLTWETLEGLMRRGRGRVLSGGWFGIGLSGLGSGLASLATWPCPSGEAQAAALADDIAYNAHDLEDGLQAGLFSIDDLDDVPLLADTRDRLAATAGMNEDLLSRGMARELVGVFVDGAIAESRRRLTEAAPSSADAIRAASTPLIALPRPLALASEAVKAFLFARMYRHPRLVDMRVRAREVVSELAKGLLDRPDLLPAKWRQEPVRGSVSVWHARRVTDYVASMTDRFAFAEHRRIFDGPADLR